MAELQNYKNTVQAVFGQHLFQQQDGQQQLLARIVDTMVDTDGTRDFTLVSDVLWELLPEVRPRLVYQQSVRSWQLKACTTAPKHAHCIQHCQGI